MDGREVTTRHRGPMVALIGLSLLACAVQMVATAAGGEWAGGAQWFAMPLLGLALVLAGGLRDPRGRCWSRSGPAVAAVCSAGRRCLPTSSWAVRVRP